ncbi:hypothetical protein [Hyphomonas jannaschiana]
MPEQTRIHAGLCDGAGDRAKGMKDENGEVCHGGECGMDASPVG